MTLQHKCTRQTGCYKEKFLPDWGILDGCFPRNIKPSDIDGVIEINGHVLFLEWKPKDKPLSNGQRRMFLTMTRDAPKQQVFIVYGDKDVPFEIELIQHGERKFRQPCDLGLLRWLCAQWGIVADGAQAA